MTENYEVLWIPAGKCRSGASLHLTEIHTPEKYWFNKSYTVRTHAVQMNRPLYFTGKFVYMSIVRICMYKER